MNYSEVRSRIQSGDILAWSHYDWSTWYDIKVQAVRMGTESEYSHVALARVMDGRVWCLESVTPLVRCVPLSNLIEKGFYWIPMGREMSPPELEYAYSKVAIAHYSQIEAVKAQICAGLQSHDENVMECAKYVRACCAMSGLTVGDKDVPAAVVRGAQDMGKSVFFVNPDDGAAQ